jgi:hypothetical protein
MNLWERLIRNKSLSREIFNIYLLQVTWFSCHFFKEEIHGEVFVYIQDSQALLYQEYG